MNPSDLYEYKSGIQDILDEKPGGDPIWVVDHVDTDGEILTYLQRTQFPLKGCPTPEVMWATNILKRVILGLFKFGLMAKASAGLFVLNPFKKRTLNKAVENFNGIVMPIYKGYLLKPKHQSRFALELTRLIRLFLWHIGVEDSQAESCAKVLGHLFLYEGAYRYRLQDLLSETTADNIAKNPGREMRRMLKKITTRDLDKGNVANKFKLAFKLASFLLKSGRIRAGLRYALKHINYENLTFDEGDLYWIFARTDYNFMGKDLATRMAIATGKGYTYPHQK